MTEPSSHSLAKRTFDKHRTGVQRSSAVCLVSLQSDRYVSGGIEENDWQKVMPDRCVDLGESDHMWLCRP